MESSTLEKDIFGSESDLSDEDEEERYQRSYRVDDQQFADEGEGEAGASRKKKRPKSDGEAGKPPRKKKKRERRPVEEEENLPELTEDQRRKLALEQQIDAIVKPNKSRPRKRKKNGDETDLERYQDEEVARLRDAMNVAADQDMEANMDKRPATAKLRMLAEVMEILQKQGLQQSICDNGLLIGVRRWLEPLPDKSLPALNIQNAFFEALPKMEIDTSTLKEAGLGKIVLFYTRCKRVSPNIRRSAEYLVDVWSRPILKRSASYRDRQIPVAAEPSMSQSQPKQKLVQILQKAKEEASRSRRNAVRIPERDFSTFTVAPSSRMPTAGPGGMAQVELERKKAADDRLRKMQRKLALNKQKNARL
ncbi:Transcription factor iws1 [Tulasnella sp. 424]|nr:Transcription factor iws1 [Tulasnella sp. 424]KAG8961848.1 Transcription factor iws1 [Tulasnella sp. 425]